MRIDFPEYVAGLLFEVFMKRYKFIDWTLSNDLNDVIEIKFRVWKEK